MSFVYTTFDRETGKIISRGEAASEEQIALYETLFPREGLIREWAESLETYYVAGERILRRPELQIMTSGTDFVADGEAEMHLIGFPDPCVLVVNGDPVELTGGEVTLTADTPATYKLECSHWPFMDWACEIEAKEPSA